VSGVIQRRGAVVGGVTQGRGAVVGGIINRGRKGRRSGGPLVGIGEELRVDVVRPLMEKRTGSIVVI